MSAPRLKFFIEAPNLFLTWELWTLIGITWLDGADDRFASCLTEEHDPLDTMNLPRVTGEISGVPFMFYRRPGITRGSWPTHTALCIYYDGLGSAARVVKALKAADLFVPGPKFHKDFNVVVCDPDGRLLQLVDPHPFRI